MKLKSILLLLLLPALMLLLGGCGGGSQPSDSPTAYPTYTPYPTHTPVAPIVTPTPPATQVLPTATGVIPIPVETTPGIDPDWEEPEAGFWNQPDSALLLPECTTDFRFSHQIADPENLNSLSFGLGSHIAPHEHMAYWGTPDLVSVEPIPGQKELHSEKVQLFAPMDIFAGVFWKETRADDEGITYTEWGGVVYTCDGHQITLGHIGDPSDAMETIMAEAETEPGCDDIYCRWIFHAYIAAGTPIFKSSGYAGGFDFGLNLFGLTAEQLQEQPGYGYSITPWRVPSGRAVCPIEYFPEPFKSEYLELMWVNRPMWDATCGPFNQDVPGTAMGFWMPSPSPDKLPVLPHERGVDEWETIWLYRDPFQTDTYSIHAISVGNNTFGLDYGQYGYSFVSEGLVNLRWDLVKPGQMYCSELRSLINYQAFSQLVENILILQLSEDGTALTVEATNNDKCGEGPWSFRGRERTFYR